MSSGSRLACTSAGCSDTAAATAAAAPAQSPVSMAVRSPSRWMALTCTPQEICEMDVELCAQFWESQALVCREAAGRRVW